jgi:CRP-like cAMP-binding protein
MHISSDGLGRLRERIGIFRNFSDADLVTLLRSTERITHPAGEVIFREGAWGDQMYIMLSGQVRISQRRGLQRAEELAILEGGDCFGEMALIDQAPRSAEAVTVTETVLLSLQADSVLRSEAAAKLFANFAAILAERLRTANEQMVHLMSSERRLAERSDKLQGKVDKLEDKGGRTRDPRVAAMRHADLRGGVLVGAKMPESDMRDADFRGADLREVDLSSADLSGANFAGADLRGADLRGARLDKASFAGALMDATD